MVEAKSIKPNDDTADVTIYDGSGKTFKVHKEVLILSSELSDTAICNNNTIYLPKEASERSTEALVDYMYDRSALNQRLYYPGEDYQGHEDFVITGIVRGYTNLHFLAAKYKIPALETLVYQAFEYWLQIEQQSLDHVEWVLTATDDEGVKLSKPMEDLVVKCTAEIVRKSDAMGTPKWQTLVDRHQDFAQRVSRLLR